MKALWTFGLVLTLSNAMFATTRAVTEHSPFQATLSLIDIGMTVFCMHKLFKR